MITDDGKLLAVAFVFGMVVWLVMSGLYFVSNRKNTEGELEKTDQYLEDLQKPCVEGDSSYEDRKKARSKEITALKEARKLDDGSLMEIAKIYPLDAVFDNPEDVPDDIKENKRYKGVGSFTIQEVVDQVKEDYGKIDILVHSLANGPEVTKPLLETSRKGYLAASSSSAYSLVSMVSRFGPIMPPGSSVLSLSYIASERVVPGYGGGMSSAKAQLESDTRTLAFEAGRKYRIRVNTISAGPLKSRAASAIGGEAGEKTFIERAIDYATANAPLPLPLYAKNVGQSALCLLSDMMSGVTGVTLYVDMGLHAMGQTLDSPAWEGLARPELEFQGE